MARRDNLQARLNQVLTDLNRANLLLVGRWDTLGLLADPLRGSTYDADGSRSGISDPTPAQAFALAHWLDLQGQIAETIHALGVHAVMLRQLLDRVPSDVDTARLAELHRCTGGRPSTEDWTRPECRRMAVTNEGLCDACRQRRDYWKAKEGRVA